MNKTLTYGSILLITVIVFYYLLEGGYINGIKTSTFIKLGQPVASTTVATHEVSTSTEPEITKVPMFHYIEVIDGCGPYFTGECVNMRAGANIEAPVVVKLRTGIVLKVIDTVTKDGRAWYKIGFDKNILYPDRVTGDWFVASGDYVQLFANEGDQETRPEEDVSKGKRIIVDISSARLYAYDKEVAFMQAPISTGLDLTPTPKGNFTIFKKTPSRYMQGPLPGVSDQAYDLPGVPWDLYFTYDGAVIHGAYWHDRFGEQWSHGCVNLSPADAKKLYMWAEVGTPVTVRY